MCRGARRPFTNNKDYKDRVVRPLKKKFARRKSSPGSTRRLFDSYIRDSETGILFGQKIYFLKTPGRKKGKKIIKYNLRIEEIEQQVHQDLLNIVSRALFQDDSDDESTIYPEIESRYGLDVSLYGNQVPEWFYKRFPELRENDDTSTEDDLDSVVTQDTTP